MKALLLAAGLGTRLQPVTNSIQKCLVPIHGKPLLQYWLENLSEAGVNRFLINLHHYADQVERFCLQSEFADQISLLHESELLLTAGTVLKNRSLLEGEPFLLVHADNLCFCDFNAFISAHESRPAAAEMTMMLFHTDNPQSCGIVELSESGLVTAFHEKVPNPPGRLANGAVYILEPSIIDFIASLGKEKIDFSTEVIPKYKGKINSFINNDYHRDIGTLESYAMAQIEMMSRFEFDTARKEPE